MKSIISMLAVTGILLSYCSCKESDNATIKESHEIPEPIIADTLSAGWSKVRLPEISLFDIYFANDTIGYVSGSRSIYKSTNGGITWKSLYEGGYNSDIGMTNNLSAFFVGDNDMVKITNHETSHVITLPFLPKDLIFVNDTTGFIIGPHGFYSSKDTGNTWIEVHTKGLIYGMYYSTLFAINENAVWVCNDRGIYKTNGSIVNWQKAIIDNSDGNEEFLAIFAPSVNIVYAMAKNKVFKSINGGDNFFLLKTFDEKFFYGDVHFINDLTGYICSGPYIYKTIDGGATWTKVVTVGNGGITEIHFTDANHGWACTDRGAVLILSNKL